MVVKAQMPDQMLQMLQCLLCTCLASKDKINPKLDDPANGQWGPEGANGDGGGPGGGFTTERAATANPSSQSAFGGMQIEGAPGAAEYGDWN